MLTFDCALSISAWSSPAGTRTLKLPSTQRQSLRFVDPGSVDCSATIWHLRSRRVCVSLFGIRGASCAREISASLTPGARGTSQTRHLTKRKKVFIAKNVLCQTRMQVFGIRRKLIRIAIKPLLAVVPLRPHWFP